MQLFGFPLSPFVRKVVVVLTEKRQEFEWEPTNPRNPSEAFTRASPFGKIPAFADGDYMLADSTAIVTYLEARLPSVPLQAVEARARGREVFFDEIADTILVPAAAPIVLNRFLKPVIFGEAGDEEAALAAEQAVEKPLAYLEAEAARAGWLNGQYGIGDIAFASVVKTLGYAGWALDAATYPALVALYARVCERPAWVAVAEREAAMFAAAGR